MSSEPICPCEEFEHPRTSSNQAGLTHVEYRAGDFRTFRRALLQPLSGEAQLTPWRPSGHGDLLLQILEWWAYVADVLTFYNERSINENLLATATLDQSVRGLVKVLGYRPRPGIGGSASLGALLSGPRPVALPRGFRVESKPAPGKKPQTFETTDVFTLLQPDAAPAAPPGQLAGPGGRLYLDGSVTSIQPGDLLILAAAGAQQNGTLIEVQQTAQRKDSSGQPFTEILPKGAPALPAADASSYRLLTSRSSAGLWKYPTSLNVFQGWLDLESVDRSIAAGQVVVVNAPGTSLEPTALNVTSTAEQIWYTNGNGPNPPVGLPHTEVYWSGILNVNDWNAEKAIARVLTNWQPVGTLRNVPVDTWNGNPPLLVATGGKQFRTGDGQTALVEDADGNGVLVTGSVASSSPTQFQVASFDVMPPPALKTPLRVLQDVISLTRGKTVEKEILGAGDATLAGQEFVLQKSPLTYLPAGDSYKSTLRVYVNGIEWTEADNFYGQSPDATIFVTYEDDDQKTHVQFGDWVNGSGLPTGAQVAASYRMESGADDVGPGGLTVISKPMPGLRAVRQPALAGGGSDPDPREQIRRYGPQSVLTFGRAISADDYEAIAARAPGVTRVRSYFAWDALEQRATVTLYAGDTAAAVDSVRNALRTAADPNRAVSVYQATPVLALLLIAVRVEPGRILEDVVANTRAALADPDTGLLGSRRTGIGESIYFSQISQACIDVPGIHSVTGAIFLLQRPDPVTGLIWGIPPRINASRQEFFAVPPQLVWIFPEELTSV